MKWIIEDNVFPENQQKIIEVCERNEIEYQVATDMSRISVANNRCIFYGSINGAMIAKRTTPIQIWIDGFECSRYYPLIEKEYLLNRDYFLIPYGELLRNKGLVFKCLEGYSDTLFSVFIRPNSGLKQFTGFSASYDDWERDIKSINMFPDELVFVSSRKKTGTEYRVLVCDGKVITGSCYLINDEIVEDPEDGLPESILSTSQEVAKMLEETWYGNYPAYTMDIMEDQYTNKVVEINSFSCAGLYGMDMEKVVLAVTESTESKLC